MNAPVTLLDCTLRDGSYAVDSKFTAADTSRICAALQAAGLRWIEIGHGVGLNGSSARNGIAAATDDEYCRAAAAVMSTAQFGAFCIPGIARLDDITRARELGMGFIRIGTNVTQVHDAEAFIRHAKRLGLYVAYNPMKSYLLAPAQFARAMHIAASFGVDAVYVVDSAGCMLPDDVTRYVDETRALIDLPIGFHGHNNLTLAAANSLAAYRAGATFVDATLQGIGRGGGNTHLEALTATFEKLGVSTGIDLLPILAAGEALVRPLMTSNGVSSQDVAMGVGGFHSSFLPRVESVLERIPVDRNRLIIELGRIERQNPTEELIAEIALLLLAQDIARAQSQRPEVATSGTAL